MNAAKHTTSGTDAWHHVRQQQASILRWLLLALLVLTPLTILVGALLVEPDSFSLRQYYPLMGVLATIALALVLLQRGGFVWAVGLAAAAIFVRLTFLLLGTGILGNEAYLMTFFIPIALVGLSLGRAALLAASGLSIAIVGVVAYLQSITSPLIGSAPRGMDLEGLLILFVFLVVLFTFFLDRFGLSFQEALVHAAIRGQALEGLNRQLQQEVQERKQAEEALRQSEERLRLALEATDMGIWTWDPSANQVIWSSAARRLFDLPADAAITPEVFYGRVHLEDRLHLEQSVAQAVAAGGRLEVEYRLQLAPGDTRWVIAKGNTVHDNVNETSQFIGVLYDVTPIRKAERERGELLEREKEVRAEVEASNQRLALLAEASQLLAGSLAYEQTLEEVAARTVPGFADWCAIDLLEGGVLQRLVVAHKDPAKVAWAKELQQKYPPNPDGKTGAYRVVRSGEAEFYPDIPDALIEQVARDAQHLRLLRELGFTSAILAPLLSREQVLGVLTLVRTTAGRRFTENDLSLATELARRAGVAIDNARLYHEARQLNEDLEVRVQRRTAELEAANRELEAFSYSVSHDLRSPLSGIAGFAQALVEDYGEVLDETARVYVHRIQANAARMSALIDDLLKLARVSRAEVNSEGVDLGELARDVAESLRSRYAHHRPALVCEDALIVQGDVGLLRIVLENLLDNAWKFTRQQQDALITVGVQQLGDERVFFVRDNGVGFKQEYAQQLFQPFKRLHAGTDFSGTGIGLVTVRRIIERHGGRIWVESEVGEGTTFFFTLGQARGEELEG